MKYAYTLIAAALLGYSGTSTVAVAQPANLAPMASMGGQLYAMTQACQLYSEAQLQGMKDQQRSAMIEQGASAQAYEKHFSIGYEKAQQDLQGLQPEQLLEVCQRITELLP